MVFICDSMTDKWRVPISVYVYDTIYTLHCVHFVDDTEDDNDLEDIDDHRDIDDHEDIDDHDDLDDNHDHIDDLWHFYWTFFQNQDLCELPYKSLQHYMFDVMK